MRQLASPLAVGHSSSLTITAAEESGYDSCCHHYEISGFALDTNPFASNDGTMSDELGQGKTTILFQKGPVMPGEVNNGITVQSLIAVAGDHIQETPTQSNDDVVLMGKVMDNLRMALDVLNKRDQRLCGQVTVNSVRESVPALN